MANPPHPKAPGPSQHVYDVIVVGGQLAGALCAALLAKHGYRVLLVEHDGIGPGYEHDGFVLPYSPFVSPPLKAVPEAEDVFNELGLTTQVSRALRPHAPELQLVLRDHRVDLHQDEARRMAELTREFDGAAEGVNAALKSLAAFHELSDPFFKDVPELPPEGIKESWAVRGKIKRAPELAKPLPTVPEGLPGSILLKLVPFLTFLDAPESPLALGRALSQVLVQPSRYPNGREGLRDAVCKRLVELGGDFVSAESSQGFIVEQMVFDGDRVDGVKLLQNETVYRAAAFIAATDAGALRRLIPDKKRHRKVIEQLDLSVTRRFLFSVNWVLPEELLPRGMGELLLVEGAEELGPLLVQIHPAKRGTKEDEKLRVVTAGAFVPATVRELGDEHLQGIAERIGAQLEVLMPFTRKHLVLASSPHLHASGVRGSRLLPHPLFAFEAANERPLGIEGIPQRTAAKNLFIANREVLPGLGYEGELLAGIRAERLAREVAKKLNPLR